MSNSSKTIDHPQLGTIHFARNKRAKRLKMRWNAKAQLAVTLPWRAGYNQAEVFVSNNLDWALQHRPSLLVINDGDAIGRQHIVQTNPAITRPRLKGQALEIPLKRNLDTQSLLLKQAHTALRRECQSWVQARVEELLAQRGLSANITFKKMHSRWGSCSSKDNLNFSLYIAQLPDELIDYIIWHEITHLTHMNHSADFWQQLIYHVPPALELRKKLRQHSLQLRPNPLS